MPKIPRGVRNNNPGNIEKGIKWKGLAKVQKDVRFCTFKSPEWGMRAMYKIFNTYRRKYGRKTVRDIIYRWAPPTNNSGHFENHTDAYIRTVCRLNDWEPDTVVTKADYPCLAYAMSYVENGGHFYGFRDFEQAMELL